MPGKTPWDLEKGSAACRRHGNQGVAGTPPKRSKAIAGGGVLISVSKKKTRKGSPIHFSSEKIKPTSHRGVPSRRGERQPKVPRVLPADPPAPPRKDGRRLRERGNSKKGRPFKLRDNERGKRGGGRMISSMGEKKKLRGRGGVV